MPPSDTTPGSPVDTSGGTVAHAKQSIGFCGLLTLIFITLKLTGYISWSWGFVVAPLWGPPVFILAILAVLICLSLISDKFNVWIGNVIENLITDPRNKSWRVKIIADEKSVN